MNIVKYPDPVLREKAKAIEEIDDALLELAEGMIEAMYEAKGVGLAAPQVGRGVRLVVMNITGEPGDELSYVNPVVLEANGSVEEEEGCLSLPSVTGNIRRAEKVKVSAYTLEGEKVIIEAEELVARVWQHEIDHLDGRLIIDRMSPARRLAVGKTLKDLKREYEKEPRPV